VECNCQKQSEIEQLKIDVAVAKSDIKQVKDDIKDIKTDMTKGFESIEDAQKKFYLWLIPTLGSAMIALIIFIVTNLGKLVK
jgi:hypothetical protein